MNNNSGSSPLDCRYCSIMSYTGVTYGLCRGYIIGVILGLHWGQKRENAKENGNYNSMIGHISLHGPSGIIPARPSQSPNCPYSTALAGQHLQQAIVHQNIRKVSTA